MAKEILCPICGATYNLAEEQLGRKLRCKKCEHAFTAGGEPRRRDEDDEDDGIQAEPRGRPRAKGRKGRDRDEDESRPRKGKSLKEQARPRSQEGPGLPVTSIVLTCVALGVLVLCCGGGAGLYYLWPSSAGPQPNPPFNQPPPFAGANQPMQPVRPGGFRQGGFPAAAAGPAITNVKEALEALRDLDAGRRRAGADWLARAPRDEAQAETVSRALDPLVRDAHPEPFGRDDARAAALGALKVWGTKENVPTLVDFLKVQKANEMGATVHIPNQLKDAMAALARIGDERGAEAILPFVGSFFSSAHLGDAPERALREMGPKAEKALVKSYNDPNDGTRNIVRRLLQQIGTKPEAILVQVAADLKAGDARHRQLAADALEKLSVVESRRTEVSRALNFALEDPDANTAAAALRAAKTWGTRENVGALIRHVGADGPFSTPQRVAAMEALAAIKDERGVWPVARWLGDFFNGKAAEPAIQKFGPVAQKVGLDHLSDADAPSRLQAWRVLALVGTRDNVAKMNAAGLKEFDPAVRQAATVAIRLSQLRP